MENKEEIRQVLALCLIVGMLSYLMVIDTDVVPNSKTIDCKARQLGVPALTKTECK